MKLIGGELQEALPSNFRSSRSHASNRKLSRKKKKRNKYRTLRRSHKKKNLLVNSFKNLMNAATRKLIKPRKPTEVPPKEF